MVAEAYNRLDFPKFAVWWRRRDDRGVSTRQFRACRIAQRTIIARQIVPATGGSVETMKANPLAGLSEEERAEAAD